ncbi:MAG: MFS transporter [Verrucomicrobia bacterium]|nr:MFS transporter [Verrucomicrobiota bacterium]
MVCLGHLFNDMFQAVIPAIYPMLKEAMGLSFLQIGAITLTNNITASLFQPLVGYFSDKHPRPYGLAVGMCFTLLGLLLLSAADSFVLVLAAVAFVGVGSSVLHPESSKVARLASGGAKGMAQSVFQVGGNIGRAFSPVVVALIIVPHGQGAIRWLCLVAIAAVILLAVIGRWYRGQIALHGHGRSGQSVENRNRLPRGRIVIALVVLLVLMFSKDFYITNIHSYLTFYLISKFGISIAASQYCLFAFLVASAAGLIAGGTLGDRWGRKYVIWVSILGAAPFALLLPYCGLVVTVMLAMLVGMIMSSAMSAILVYATELLPGNIGMVSGAFFGLSFGLGGIGSALFGWLADVSSIQYVFQLTAFLPLLGAVTYFLPDIKD